MCTINKLGNCLLLILAISVGIMSCQKMERPALGNYPKDTNPPGGPLKFYAAMDGTNVDSIRANFGLNNDVSFAAGVSGDALQPNGDKNGFVSYPSANDFSNVSSFTISFWMNVTLAQKDSVHAEGVLAFANSNNFWSNVCIYADHESVTSDSMQLKFHFNAANNTDNWQAANYVGNKRWPKMYDGQWHLVTITYDASDSLFTAYRDGAQFDQMTMNPAIKFENSSQLIVAGFQEAVGIVDNYGDNSWMAGFPGLMDNIRLYGEALSAADVQSLYTNKQ